jgi:cellulose biosynthesis protein BcsQ
MMERLTLVVADSDQEYLEMLIKYVRTSEFSSIMTIKAFSNKEHLNTYITTQPAPHITLIGSELMSDDEFKSSLGMVILLVPSQFSQDTESHPSLFKYQPIHQLLSTMKKMYLEQHEVIVEQTADMGKTKVVSFYSMVGCSGKTTAAINMSRELSLIGKKVMYLSLESISSSPVWFGSTSKQGFEEILYYVKTNAKQVAAKIFQHKKIEPETGLMYIEPITYIKEIEDITREDVIGLVDALVNSSVYEYVVIDCDANFHERTLAALERSHEIILLALDDVQCVYKTQAGLSYLQAVNSNLYEQIRNITHLVINKYTGKLTNSIELEAFEIQGYLPLYSTVEVCITRRAALLVKGI